MPPHPKRSDADDFPISEENILRADDPRPQRVPQYPSSTTGARRPLKKAEEAIPTAIYDTEKADQEMQASYGMGEQSYKPAFLYVERGPGAGQLLEVKQGTVVIGRASVSDLRLQHPSISRRHAQVRRIGEQFFVKDLGSQNGSFVNKTRIASEVEVKIGDSLALGNALIRLRGPMQKGEKPVAPSTGKARVPTAVVARPTAAQTSGHVRPVNSNRMVKIAVFAGAVGFGLAAVLAFALIRMATGSTTTSGEKTAKAAITNEPNDAIADALKRKQAESGKVVVTRTTPAAAVQNEEPAQEEPSIDEGPATVKSVPGVTGSAPSVAPARTAPNRVAIAAKRAAAGARNAAAASSDDEDNSAASAKGGGKRSQILAPYERGNAEGSLELAKSAGDKELSDKLLKFISSYDSGQEALLSNNGTVAIKEFTKALALDEQLSSGWGKYGSEIRKHLGNLYFLVGKQYEANGDDEKAKAAYAASLKNDPANSKAKGALANLSGGGGDDEAPAPAPKPAPKKAPSKTSIDDAFGD
ncbi:MAG: FHA domain-containing protein [Archangiaceae bacterium]|nr:FHA domain-containing protein [Archangiaceae bacterium]